MIKIYTDGATSGNGKADAIGGWAYIVLNDNNEIISQNSGYITKATNNICELTAILMGCEAVKDTTEAVTIYSDSAYCINCYQDQWYLKWQKNGWLNSKKQPVANRELWEKLIHYFDDSRFSFKKVKGHSGNATEAAYWNELVDKMAVSARQGNSFILKIKESD